MLPAQVKELALQRAHDHVFGMRTGIRVADVATLQDSAFTAETCPDVEAGQIYRFIAGIDTCMLPMTSSEIQTELQDPWAQSVLIPNSGGKGVWPDTVAEIVNAINQANPGIVQTSYVLGEGSQIPNSTIPPNYAPGPRNANRDLRYVVTWGSGQSPTIFMSALPAGVQGGTPPAFLQVIAYDASKKGFNYYQYVNNQAVTSVPAGNDVQTWAWAGDSTYARRSGTIGMGCFDCHLNGGLNMKELTPPWNNWSSNAALISPQVVPEAVASDPLFQNATNAGQLQNNFQGSMFTYTSNWVASYVQNGTVSNVSELLRRLLVTTTVNFVASQVQSSASNDVNLPTNPQSFFLNDRVLSDVLNIPYTTPANLAFNRAEYNDFLTSNGFKLVNEIKDGTPQYTQAGSTYFALFVPGPAYEDEKAAQQLIQQNAVNAQFVGSVMMVDFQNAVFSKPRESLMQYAEQISSAPAVPDPNDVPHQFAALVEKAAQGQPACDPSQLSKCTPEQQFLYYWNSSDWTTAAKDQINSYLNAVSSRIGTQAGLNDYMTLAASRQVQFANYPLVCNLFEFTLLLPQTGLGDIFVQMDTDGTISPQNSYSCPSS